MLFETDLWECGLKLDLPIESCQHQDMIGAKPSCHETLDPYVPSVTVPLKYSSERDRQAAVLWRAHRLWR